MKRTRAACLLPRPELATFITGKGKPLEAAIVFVGRTVAFGKGSKIREPAKPAGAEGTRTRSLGL